MKPEWCPLISNYLYRNSTHCLINNGNLIGQSKKIRSVNRLIKFIKKKYLEEVQPSLSIEVLPSTLFTLSLPSKIKPILSFSRPILIDVPPEVTLNQNLTPYLPRSLKDVSLRTQPPPQSSVLPNEQSYCTTCQKIFSTKEDEKYHQETQYGRENCYLLRNMLP